MLHGSTIVDDVIKSNANFIMWHLLLKVRQPFIHDDKCNARSVLMLWNSSYEIK